MRPSLESSDHPRPLLPAEPARDATMYLARIEPARWFDCLRRRGWVAALCVAAAVAAMWAYLARAPKIYQAHGAVYVSTEAPQILDIRAVLPAESRDLEQLHSVADGMVSSTLLLRVIEREGLAADPGFAAGTASEQQLLEKLRGAVTVALRRGTRIIDLHVEDRDPERARRLVDSIKTNYENWTAERQENLTEVLSQGLAREEQRLRTKMEESAAKVQQFREANAVPGLEAGPGAPVRDELGDLTAQLTRARAERLQLEAQVDAFQRFDPADPDAVSGLGEGGHAAEVLALVRTLRDKQVEFERVKERYLHKHPVYQETANEVATLQRNLEAAARSAGEALEKTYQVAADNERKLAAEVDKARGAAVTVDGLRASFAVLSREAEADRELYASVARRLRETGLAAAALTSFLRWEEIPLAPERPIRPRKKIMLPLAACGGMFLGLLLIVGLELADRRVRDITVVTRATGVPMLARVPAVGPNGNGGLVMVTDPTSETAEAFRRLRAVLGAPGPDDGPRTVLFTSARDGEGKSFCALNYAAALALQGHRTLLVDADLRRLGLSRHPSVGGDTAPGLGDYLAGTTRPADTCLRTPLPKLCLIASGKIRADAAELLAGTRFPALLDDAFRWFDRVVIDAPAVLAASDAQAIARYADGACLVVNQRTADRHELHRTAEMLRAAGGKLIGFVWNDVPGERNQDGGPYVSAGRAANARAGLAVDEPMPTVLPTLAPLGA